MQTRIVLSIALAGLGLVLLEGCGSGEGAGDDEVIAAFYPLAFAAERVGGDELEVRNLTPPGVEPHDLELSARTVRGLSDARVVLYLGQGFQPALEDALESADIPAVDLLENLELLEGEEGRDPHVWLDPVRYAELVTRIGIELDHEEAAGRLVGELEALDRTFRDGLADCERRALVTSHAAFGYLADRYDLEQVAISGFSPEAEPTPRELERVVDVVRGLGATTVFFETLVSPRLAQTVAREVGAETAVLDPLEGLSGDSREAGEDYFSVMRANLAALRKALTCR